MVRPNKPMENKDSGGGHGIRRILRAIVALIVSAATLLTGASTALATQARLLVQPGVGRQRLVHRMARHEFGCGDLQW